MKEPLTSALRRFVSSRIIPFLFIVLLATPALSQFTSQVSFDTTNGGGPYYGPLIQGRDGNLYGTTYGGGGNGVGTLFQFNPIADTETPIYSFCALSNCTDGSSPAVGVTLGTDGNFYGTTVVGGDMNGCNFPSGCGIVFKFTSTPTPKLTTLHTFERSDGAALPVAPLMQGTDGRFYSAGGLSGGVMEVYRITSTGTYKALADQQASDGGLPYGGLIQATDGNFYGTTNYGGTSSACNDACGTVFKITPAGKLTILHSFNLTDGSNPVAGLVQASNGKLYGTTAAGGPNLFAGCGQGGNAGCGTVFEITTGGTFNTLYSFCSQANCADGGGPFGTLVQATDGNLYGTTNLGGCCGTIFKISTSGAFNTLYTLCDQHAGCPGTELDGFASYAGLVQSTNGLLYGTTFYGGTSPNCPYGCGTIFSFNAGLSPFVEALTYSGKVGANIEFLGQGFTKSSTVSFDGTPATPAGITATYLTAKVPSGATTGSITITTPAGTLTSNKIFRVIPQVKTFNPPSGPVGTVVTITGVSLTQTTQVTIGGKVAATTVNSDTQVSATVPAGAKTGRIVITTAGGSATSSGTFTVTP